MEEVRLWQAVSSDRGGNNSSLLSSEQAERRWLLLWHVLLLGGMYSNFGIYFSLLTEGEVPLKVSGLAIGIASTLGYLPEVIAPIVAGNILDTFAGAKGYHIYFGIMIAMAVIGFIISIVWGKILTENVIKSR